MDTPVITEVRTEVYEIPTDQPEADGTLSWDSTTMVLARVTAGDVGGLGWTYAGKSWGTRPDCDAGVVDCLQIDVTRCGGYTDWVRAAGVAAGHGLQVSGHCAPNLHAHVAGSVANLRHLEYFHDHHRIENMLFDGALDPSGGELVPRADGPGHGLTFKEADAAQFQRGSGGGA